MLDLRLEQATVWLTQAQMAELFGRERSVITKHLGSVFREGELEIEYFRLRRELGCGGVSIVNLVEGAKEGLPYGEHALKVFGPDEGFPDPDKLQAGGAWDVALQIAALANRLGSPRRI